MAQGGDDFKIRIPKDEPRRRDGVGVRRLSIVALDFLRRTRFGDPRMLIDRFSVSLLTFDRGSY
jgi:hypothetical protein